MSKSKNSLKIKSPKNVNTIFGLPAKSYTDNEFTTPRYMLKQAMIHEGNGDYADALALYKEIEADYKSSREGNGIEKYIARVENR